jgi:hypothetical protein
MEKKPTSAKASAGSKTGRPTFSAGRYLKYAIGEIILVMIGILLALQVNNWNNERLEAKKEQLFLINLRSDFKTNLNELNSAYNGTLEAYRASRDLLEIIKADPPLVSSEVNKLLDEIINKISSLDLISGSIDEITNTGSLNIINDPKLRKLLSNWPYYEADTDDDIKIMIDNLMGFFLPSLFDTAILRNTPVPALFEEDLDLPKISPSGFTIDYNESLKTLAFENQVYNNALNYMYTLNQYKRLEKYLRATLERIEANIK